jgi:hypothetical protein
MGNLTLEAVASHSLSAVELIRLTAALQHWASTPALSPVDVHSFRSALRPHGSNLSCTLLYLKQNRLGWRESGLAMHMVREDVSAGLWQKGVSGEE